MNERLTGLRIYSDTGTLYGVADATLPNIEAKTETLTGAGIAGDIDTPSIGLFGSMTLSLNWRTVEKEAAELMKAGTQTLEIRGNIQSFNQQLGTYEQHGLKIFVKGLAKKLEGGKAEVGATMDIPQEFEVIYYKKSLNGEELIEIDKFNYVYKVNGVDQLKQVRENLGI